ncbi:MAG: hypothetical protein IJK34_00125 [Clostridia bacterium]|nr:hypothetical protein [Clostridia bacterium]
MYFSKHNEKIVYINHYSGLLEVEGEGVLCKEDAEAWPTMGRKWQNEYDTLSVKEGITGLGEGYLESFTKIDCLILSRTVGTVAASPELLKSWRKRKVLIRGEYDTFAERFAGEKGLKFRHCDIPLADDDIEIAHEHDIITLRFHDRGRADIHYNCFTPGSTAGSYGGGEYAKELPKDFYVDCSLEQFASNFPERLHDQLMSNGMLSRFLDKANSRIKKPVNSKKKTQSEK